MKKVLLLLLALNSITICNAQVFHFDTHSTTLVKNTDQSPAHWYIEIITDVQIDTTLRWKAIFGGIPSAWQISMDDQTNYTTNIQDGDSSDFILYAGLPYYQKLIIGATLNDQPGTGSVYFKVYDPELPTYSDTIEFVFIISAVGLVELVSAGIINYANNTISLENGLKTTLKVFDLSGKLIVEDGKFKKFDCSSLRSNEVYYLTLEQESKHYTIKWMR